jgi:hypothetical protein
LRVDHADPHTAPAPSRESRRPESNHHMPPGVCDSLVVTGVLSGASSRAALDASSPRFEPAWSVTNDGKRFRHGTPSSAIQIGCADQIDFPRPMDSSSLVPSNMKAVRDMDGYRFLYAGGYIPFFVRPYLPCGPFFRRQL